MKLRILILSLLIIQGLELHAQKLIGVEAGMSVSTLNLPNEFNFTPKPGTGLKLGFAYLYKFTDKYDLQSGLYYYQKGQKTTEEIRNTDYKYTIDETYKLNFVEMPLALNYNIRNFYISGGIYLSFGMNSFYYKNVEYYDLKLNKVTKETSREDNIAKESEDYKYFMDQRMSRKSCDYGLMAGAGYRFGKFALKTDYNYGLRKYSRFLVDPSEDIIGSFKNYSLSISLVYYMLSD